MAVAVPVSMDDLKPPNSESDVTSLAGHARRLALGELHLVLEAVKKYVSSASPQGLLRDGAELVRREPVLALGASLLLGAVLGRRWPASDAEGKSLPTPAVEPAAQAAKSSAQQPDFRASAGRLPTFDPVAIHQAPTTAVPAQWAAGSPIGDSPGAGGLAS